MIKIFYHIYTVVEKIIYRLHKKQNISSNLVLFVYYLMICCLVLFVAIAYYQREWVYVFGGVTAVILSLIPSILKRNYHFHLPLPLEILIVISLFFHVGGEVLGGYRYIPHYDTLTHFISGFTVAFLAFIIIYILHVYWDGLVMDKYAMAFLVVLCTIAMGVVWEFTEWFSDMVFSTYTQWSYQDTIKDLAVDTFAGILVAVIGVNMIKKGTFQVMTQDLGFQIDKKIIQKIAEKSKNKEEKS